MADILNALAFYKQIRTWHLVSPGVRVLSCVCRFLLDIDELFYQAFLSGAKKRALKAVQLPKLTQSSFFRL